MMDLTKGDINNLEGKVIVFSTLKTEKETRIFAAYSTTDILDFLEKIGAPKQEAEYMAKEERKMLREIKRDKRVDELLPFYTSPIPIESEVDIYLGQEDVLNVGEFSHPATCISAVLMGVEFYLLHLQDKIKRKHKLKGEEERSKEEEKKVSYRSIGRDLFRDYILKNFVTPIIDSYSHKRKREIASLNQNFIEFSRSAPFAPDILELVDLLKTTKGKPDIKLVEAYVEKVDAINKEDYETAAECRDRIRKLGKK